VPPLALLALALGAELPLAVLFSFVSSVAAPAIFAALTCAIFFASIVLAWSRHGRAILPLHWLVFAPFYAVMKVPLYVKFFLDRQRDWIRGERDLHS